MSVKIVTYDLNLETKRPNITKIIRDEFAYAKLSESSYAVETDLSAEAVYMLFEPILDDNDSLLVIPLKQPYFGQATKDVIEWLDASLTY